MSIYYVERDMWYWQLSSTPPSHPSSSLTCLELGSTPPILSNLSTIEKLFNIFYKYISNFISDWSFQTNSRGPPKPTLEDHLKYKLSFQIVLFYFLQFISSFDCRVNRCKFFKSFFFTLHVLLITIKCLLHTFKYFKFFLKWS